LGVFRDGARPLPHAEVVAPGPLAIHPDLATGLLHLRPLGRVEEVLPRDIDAGEVADVDEALLGEAVTELRIELPVDLTIVEHRRLAARLRRDYPEEELPHRPARQVRALAVEEDRLVGRIGRRSVDALAFAGQVAVFPEQV